MNVPGDHLWHFITENWINFTVSFIIFNHVDHGSLLNPVLLRFDFTVYIMFQVNPRVHRLLLEVFDENRLVSCGFFPPQFVYNFNNTEKFSLFSCAGQPFLCNWSSSVLIY